MTLVPGSLRQEPVSLLVGVGATAVLCMGFAVNVVRAFLYRVVELELRFDPPEAPRETPLELCVTARPGPESRRGTVPFVPGSVLSVDLRSGSRVRTVNARFSREDSSGRYRFPFDGLPRGLYRPENVQLTIPDPFRVSTYTPRCTVRDSAVRILPRTREMSVLLDMHGLGEDILPEYIDRERGGEFVDVRPYVPGDDINRLNWNMYAHTGELFLRIPEELPPPLRAVVVIVDTVQTTNGHLDQVIETALGLAEALRNNSHQVLMAFISEGVPVTVGTIERTRRVSAVVDHRQGFLSMQSNEIVRNGRVETGSTARLLVTTGLSRRSPPELRGEWIVMIPMEGSEGEARRLAPLCGDD